MTDTSEPHSMVPPRVGGLQTIFVGDPYSFLRHPVVLSRRHQFVLASSQRIPGSFVFSPFPRHPFASSFSSCRRCRCRCCSPSHFFRHLSWGHRCTVIRSAMRRPAKYGNPFDFGAWNVPGTYDGYGSAFIRHMTETGIIHGLSRHGTTLRSQWEKCVFISLLDERQESNIP